jgi:hypothetical protein
MKEQSVAASGAAQCGAIRCMVRRGLLRTLAAAAISGSCVISLAQVQPATTPSGRSLEQYGTHLRRLQAIVSSCKRNPSLCDPGSVDEDDRVELQDTGGAVRADARSVATRAMLLPARTEMHARYDWLRETLTEAKRADVAARQRLMEEDAVRLDEMTREMGSNDRGGFAEARQSANTILARPEFAAVEETSLWQRAMARFFQWLDSLFSGVARFGKGARWFGPLLEWGSVVLAASSLLGWAFRVTRRQRLTLERAAEGPLETIGVTVRDWRLAAQERAAAEKWREAVHCLYWASIASMERHRLWGRDTARTPREYLALLQGGTTRRLLEQQTRHFERIWYGLRPAAKEDYTRSLALHEQIEAVQ